MAHAVAPKLKILNHTIGFNLVVGQSQVFYRKFSFMVCSCIPTTNKLVSMINKIIVNLKSNYFKLYFPEAISEWTMMMIPLLS